MRSRIFPTTSSDSTLISKRSINLLRMRVHFKFRAKLSYSFSTPSSSISSSHKFFSDPKQKRNLSHSRNTLHSEAKHTSQYHSTAIMDTFADLDMAQWCTQPLPSSLEPQSFDKTAQQMMSTPSSSSSTSMMMKKQQQQQQLEMMNMIKRRTSPSSTSGGAGPTEGSGRLLPFPFRLHRMLDDVERAGKQDVVSWMPCGRSFKVHKISRFVNEIVPVYFNLTQYKSFKRQLINYGFVRIQNGLLNSKFL